MMHSMYGGGGGSHDNDDDDDDAFFSMPANPFRSGGGGWFEKERKGN